MKGVEFNWLGISQTFNIKYQSRLPFPCNNWHGRPSSTNTFNGALSLSEKHSTYACNGGRNCVKGKIVLHERGIESGEGMLVLWFEKGELQRTVVSFADGMP